jgi:hypothetical protein
VNIKRVFAGALLSGGVAVAGLGLAAGTAQADDAQTWCPGQSLWITGNHITNPTSAAASWPSSHHLWGSVPGPQYLWVVSLANWSGVDPQG